ncbi:MAG: phosphoribosyltransferase family protein [Bryobacteraceae bacterium]
MVHGRPAGGCCKLERWRWVFSSSGSSGDLLPALGSALHKTVAVLFNLLFPDECRICGQKLAQISRIPVCRACLRAPEPLAAACFCVSCRTPFLNRAPLDEQGRCALCRLGARGFDAAYSYGAYEGTLRELIHLFKYSRIRPLAGPLGDLLAQAIPREERFDAVVPVPLHWRRRLARGFNQSALLAQAAARRYGLRVLHAVRRRRATSAQAGLSNAERRANVAGAFRVRRRRVVAGRRILLVDDVMTTGATASACAAALKRAGAGYVALLALARVDRRTSVEPFRAPSAAVGAS